MRDALLRDLSGLPYEIITALDARLKAPVHANSLLVHSNDDNWRVWQKAMKEVDAVFLIAPESDGLLTKLTELAQEQGKYILGCGAEAVRLTSSKLATYRTLQQAGISTIPTYTRGNLPQENRQWLVKPDDGAGCEDTFCFNNKVHLHAWLAENTEKNHVIQPFCDGQAASISCVMRHGRAQLLSCNTQLIEREGYQLRYHGSVINGMHAHFTAFAAVAAQVASALPTLNGYVGIDVIVNGEEVIVVEINPRLTTSYCALSQAIGANPAELIINTLLDESFAWPKLAHHLVEVHV